MNLLALRLSAGPLQISRPFDRLAVESVLYQVFLGCTALWSDEAAYHSFDPQFWHQTESLLENSILFPGFSNILNSPVLGVPVSLFRLAIQVKNMYQNPKAYNFRALNDLRSEVEVWEATVLCDREIDSLAENETSAPYQVYYKSISYLFALIFSLLLEHISSCPALDMPMLNEYTTKKPQVRTPPTLPSDSWQVQKAMQILLKHRGDDQWAGCFIGTWPVYTLGFFLGEMDHIEIIRQDLNRRWESTRFIQVARFLEDLEATWSSRFGISPTFSSSSDVNGMSPLSMQWKEDESIVP